MEPEISQYRAYESFLSHSSGIPGKKQRVQDTQAAWEEPSRGQRSRLMGFGDQARWCLSRDIGSMPQEHTGYHGCFCSNIIQ